MVRTRGMKKKEEEPVEDVVPEDEEEEEKYAKKAEMAPPKKCQCCCMPCRCWYYLFCVLAIVGVLVYMTYYDWPEVDRSEWGLSEFSKEIFKNLRAKPTTNFRWELPALLVICIIYTYGAEIEKKNWNVICGGLGFIMADWCVFFVFCLYI
jgi:hypothetical protein